MAATLTAYIPNSEITVADVTSLVPSFGFIDTTSYLTNIRNAGDSDLTLGPGFIVGQLKKITLIQNGPPSGTATVNSDHFLAGVGATLVFSNLGYTVELMWTRNGWRVISTNDGLWPAAPLPSYGQMFFSENTEDTTFSPSDDWKVIEGPVLGYNTTPGVNFVYVPLGGPPFTGMMYIGSQSIQVKASASVAWEKPALGLSREVQIAFAIGGTIVDATIQDSRLDNQSSSHRFPRNASCQGIFTLNENEIVTLQVRNTTNDQDLLISSLNINLHSI
jgi:hypothetical protein